MLKGRAAWRIAATIVVLGFMWGCAAKSPLLPSSPPSSTPQWTWGKVPTKVVPFGDDAEIQVTPRTGKGSRARNLLGQGVSQQLMSALEQSMAFDVLGYRPAQEEIETPELEEAVDTEAADKSAEESGESRIEISGTLLTYALSPTSVVGGVNEDPLLKGLADDPAASSTFQQLAEKAKRIKEDKISIELRLMDAQAKNEISAIAFHCTSEDWESTLKGWFDEPLRQALIPPRTPIQKATQACLLKVVNWLGDKYDSWKKNPERFPNYRKIQKDLNTLGYNCGPVDGKRGSKTEICIQWFLSDKEIGEKDLESSIAEELKRLLSP